MAALAAGWVVSRAVLVALLAGPQAWVGGDVAYFADALRALGDGAGWDQSLTEYPVPAVAVVAVPWLVATTLGLPYGAVLVLVALATDLAFTVLLVWVARRQGTGLLPAVVWVVAVPALGATAFARFDLLPGVLAGSALVLVATWPRVAAVCLAVATAVKLWPVVLAPPLLAATARRAAVGWYGGVGLALAAVSMLVAGPARLVSPLGYQSGRGLQIESVAATPVMVAWWLEPDRWAIGYAPSRSYEVTGPAVGVWLAATTLATMVYALMVVAGTVVLASLWRRRRTVDPDTMVWCALAAVLGFVVTGKVLSPQYLLWLLPLAAAGLVVADGTPLRQWTAGLVGAAALTQVVFPFAYGSITTGVGPPVAVPVLALAVRNLLLVLLLVAAVREAWQRVSEADRSPASHRGRRTAAAAPRGAATPTETPADPTAVLPRQTRRSPGGRRRAPRPPRRSRLP
jgi:hypothetical protein